MTLITKDALYPGRYKLPDGRSFTCKPGEVHYYRKRMRDWLNAGLPIPVTWEHLKTDLSASDKAKNTISHLTDCAIGKDGAKEFLEIKFLSDDEADTKRLPKVKYVSPTIKWDVVDSTGKIWHGPSITDIAITPIPIQHGQKPFTLSQAGPELLPIHLSMEAYEPVHLGEFPPKDEEKPTEKPAEKKPEAEEPDADAEALAEQEKAAGLTKKLQTCLEALATQGLVIGADIQPDLEVLLDRLTTACHTKKAAETPGDVGPDGKPKSEENADGTSGKPTEVQGPMMMSQREQDTHRANLKLRIERLWNRKQITKPMHDAMMSELNTVKLSAAKDGSLIEPKLLVKVESFEELPENYTAFKRGVNLSAATEVDDPPEKRGSVPDVENQKKVGKIMAEMANGTYKKPVEN